MDDPIETAELAGCSSYRFPAAFGRSRIEMFADDSCVVGVGFFERVRRDIESRYHMAVLAKAPNTREANSAAGAGDDDFPR